MKNLFDECNDNFIKVQIALGVLRDTRSKIRRSPSHQIFYEEKETEADLILHLRSVLDSKSTM